MEPGQRFCTVLNNAGAGGGAAGPKLAAGPEQSTLTDKERAGPGWRAEVGQAAVQHALQRRDTRTWLVCFCLPA